MSVNEKKSVGLKLDCKNFKKAVLTRSLFPFLLINNIYSYITVMRLSPKNCLDF